MREHFVILKIDTYSYFTDLLLHVHSTTNYIKSVFMYTNTLAATFTLLQYECQSKCIYVFNSPKDQSSKTEKKKNIQEVANYIFSTIPKGL